MIVWLGALFLQSAPQPVVPGFGADTRQLISALGYCLQNKTIALSRQNHAREEAFGKAKLECANIRNKAHDSLLRDELRIPLMTPDGAKAATEGFLLRIEAVAMSESEKELLQGK